RVGDVAHRGEVRDDGEKIERRRYHQESFRPGEAFELDAERAPHLAARAVGADQPGAAVLADGAVVRDADRDAALVLARALDAARKRDAEIARTRQRRVQDARELELLRLDSIGVRGQVGDRGEVELGDDAVALRAVLKLPRDAFLSDEIVRVA